MDFLIAGIRPLPGRHVTDHQMRLYMTFRQTDGPAIAAAKAAISPATAYRFEQDHRLPSAIHKVRTRRRPDPLADFFDTDGCPATEGHTRASRCRHLRRDAAPPSAFIAKRPADIGAAHPLVAS
jgi:hypothetical protein